MFWVIGLIQNNDIRCIFRRTQRFKRDSTPHRNSQLLMYCAVNIHRELFTEVAASKRSVSWQPKYWAANVGRWHTSARGCPSADNPQTTIDKSVTGEKTGSCQLGNLAGLQLAPSPSQATRSAISLSWI